MTVPRGTRLTEEQEARARLEAMTEEERAEYIGPIENFFPSDDTSGTGAAQPQGEQRSFRGRPKGTKQPVKTRKKEGQEITPPAYRDRNVRYPGAPHISKTTGTSALEEQWCKLVIFDGLTKTEAAQKVYACANQAEALKLGLRVAARPRIKRRLEQLDKERAERGVHDAAQIRNFVLERLHLEASNAKSPASARIRALELLGKLDVVSMFTEKREIEIWQHRTSTEIEAQLVEKIERFFGGLQEIKGIPPLLDNGDGQES